MDILSEVLRVVRLSGAIHFCAEFTHPWAILTPPPDMVASHLARAPRQWWQTATNHLVREATKPGPGNGAVLARLSELLFMQVLRWQLIYISDGHNGWFAGLNDAPCGSRACISARRSGRRLDRRRPGAEIRDVTCGACQAFRRARRRVAHAVSGRLANASGATPPSRNQYQRRRARRACGIRIRGGLQPRFPAIGRSASGHMARRQCFRARALGTS